MTATPSVGSADTAAETRLGLSLALGGLVIVLDTTITVVAVPELVRVFDAPLATLQWTTTAYLLALVATLPLAAWLGARLGLRNAHTMALVVFVIGSIGAGLAQDPGQLIAARVVQGLGGGLINPINMTLALRHVPADRRGRVASLLGLPVLIGPVLGPVLAGWMIDAVSWRAAFLVTVPPALLSVLAVRRLTRSDPPADRSPLDLAGTALLVPGAAAVVYGVGQATASGWLRIGALVLGAGLLAGFVRRSLRRAAPLLQIRLLADPVFGRAQVVLVLFAAAYFGSMLLTPTYVQITRGDPAVVAGSLSIPLGLAAGISLQICTRLIDRLPARRIVGTGLVLAGVAVALMIVVLRPDTPYPVIGGLSALLGLGSGAVLMPMITVATRQLSGAALASGSSMVNLHSQLASAIGNAAITALLGGALAARTGGLGLEEVSHFDPAARAAVAADLVAAQQLALLAPLLLIVAALVAVRRLPGRARTTSEVPIAAGPRDGAVSGR